MKENWFNDLWQICKRVELNMAGACIQKGECHLTKYRLKVGTITEKKRMTQENGKEQRKEMKE